MFFSLAAACYMSTLPASANVKALVGLVAPSPGADVPEMGLGLAETKTRLANRVN